MSPDMGSQTPTVRQDPLSAHVVGMSPFPLGILGSWSHLTATRPPSPKAGPNVGSLIINGNSALMLVTFYK